MHVLTWIFLASYYFGWGANEASISLVTIDESGWVPDGAFSRELTQNSEVAEDEENSEHPEQVADSAHPEPLIPLENSENSEI